MALSSRSPSPLQFPSSPTPRISSSPPHTPIPSTPFHNHGSRRLDRTPATRESHVKRARIIAHATPPAQRIQRLSLGSIFDLPPGKYKKRKLSLFTGI